ncbi:MAG: putative metal-binding motif-containing protein [Alphaproteobacteria bacterium]|nr:putative metal-binding motif-containing protein [Alphaproteobacteria bacterium]
MRGMTLCALLALWGCKGEVSVDDSAVIDDTGPGEAVDADGDGVPEDQDCDDNNPDVFPGNDERCDDLDNDCDGEVDEPDAVDAITLYGDEDADGYGDPAQAVTSCEHPAGLAGNGDDCDDADPTINPEADEVCDGVDNDCDGEVDVDAVDALTAFADVDGDGFGDDAAALESCALPEGYTLTGGDCDDTRSDVYPEAPEVCDEADGDCDGTVDEGVTTTFWQDVDGDTYGDADRPQEACAVPTGYAATDDDCDDGDGAIHPGADETCDNVDNDCDGDTDEDDAVDATTWNRDVDGDGYGDPDATITTCAQPTGVVLDDTDCDDTDADIHPGADEVCDSADNDCDGTVDEDDALDAATWYADTDGDAYGDASVTDVACDQPTGYVSDDTDCDDGESTTNPGAPDDCDGIDNDCDGVTDPTGVDTDGDGTDNCLDPTVYSYDFDDGAWTNWLWVDLGGGNSPNWSMANGVLSERSNAADSISIGPDLGPLNTYTITVEKRHAGGANNGSAIIFGYLDSSNYWMARWMDPNGYYGQYTNGGRVDLYECVSGTCTELATDDGSMDLTVGSSTWITMSVTIDYEDITINWDGTDVVSYTHTGYPIGADIVGLWTFDNDSGVYFDNFEVTNP